ncbi:MAG TPA: SDR family oxidoreductase [Polyangia bacterium]|jgi:NAD(P)-dependent dehydrogenase (short-subunit alcohol dehydrogenase family)|nr:SDR family oxidoreductase [Polyangia bacterium]
MSRTDELTTTPGQIDNKHEHRDGEADGDGDRSGWKGVGVVVTGGSRGLGRALGEELAAAGARVVLVARDRGPLDEVTAGIRARGGQAHGIVGDVGDREAAYAIAGQAAAAVGEIDLLINNASTLGALPLRLLLDTDCEDLTEVLQVNLVGPFRLTKALVGPMLLRGRGTVLNVSSDAAVEAYERWGAYGASKAALDHLTRTWAAELAGTGVRVLSIDPGEMNTRMHAQAIPDADPASLADPARVARAIVAWLGARPPAPSGTRTAIRLDARGGGS